MSLKCLVKSKGFEIISKDFERPWGGFLVIEESQAQDFSNQFFKGIVSVNKSNNISKTKHIPILFISGEADPVGEKGEGVKDVYRQYNGHGYTQLTLELVKDARHEVLNEVNKLSTYKFILNWLDTSE